MEKDKYQWSYLYSVALDVGQPLEKFSRVSWREM